MAGRYCVGGRGLVDVVPKLLAPGEKEEVCVTIPVQLLASYSEKKAAWILEKADYELRIGNSSDQTAPAAVLSLPETVTVEQCVNICPKDNEFEATRGLYEGGAGADVPFIRLEASDVPQRTVSYSDENRAEYTTDKTGVITLEDVKSGKASVEELVAQLTIEELASFATGRHARKGESSVIGNASFSVPGAAGDTSAVCLESRGIRPVSMADGPAGLRLGRDRYFLVLHS